MFYFKIAVLGMVCLVTFIQLLCTGMNFLDGVGKRKTDFVPTSFVQALVVDVVLPTPEEAKEAERRIPGYYGKAIVEYRDQAGFKHRQEFMRINSGGRTEVYDKKVGDKLKIEIPNPNNGSASTQEKSFWGNTSNLLLGFAAILIIASIVFRLL